MSNGQRKTLLAPVTAAVIGAISFALIATLVQTGVTQSFDEQLLRACRAAADPGIAAGPKWLGEAGRDMTALGGTAVLLPLSISVATFLALTGRRRDVRYFLPTCAIGYAVMEVLKLIFNRPRPTVVPHLSYVTSSSFPSGHSMMSAIIYGTLAVLIAQSTLPPRAKRFLIAMALLVITAVGASRVYMGVHYPTDVMGGWAAGLAWVGIYAAVRRG